MNAIICIADKKGRIMLPGFANATVILEPVGPNEYRVRRVEVSPADELHFTEEEMPLRLSKRDARKMVKALEKPPRPNAAARRAAKRFKGEQG